MILGNIISSENTKPEMKWAVNKTVWGTNFAFITRTFHVGGHWIRMWDARLHKIASFYRQSGTYANKPGATATSNQKTEPRTKKLNQQCVSFFFFFFFKIGLVSVWNWLWYQLWSWTNGTVASTHSLDAFLLYAVRLTPLSWLHGPGVHMAAA